MMLPPGHALPCRFAGQAQKPFDSFERLYAAHRSVLVDQLWGLTTPVGPPHEVVAHDAAESGTQQAGGAVSAELAHVRSQLPLHSSPV